jgi:ribosomal protein L40E
MSLLPKDLENMLGTKEEFNKNVCPECHRVFSPVDNRDCRTCLEQEAENRFEKLDEDGDDLVREKINQEYQDNMRDDLFNEIATDALLEAGLTEDEAERQLEDFKN